MPRTPTRQKYVPKHRDPKPRSFARQAPRTVVRNAALLSTAAVAVTGVAVGSGVNGASNEPVAPGNQLDAAAADPTTQAFDLGDRSAVVSRSDSRERTDAAKEAELDQDQGGAVTRSEDLSSSDPRDIARALMPEYGFSLDQFDCLDQLYISESNWQVDADNPTSSAYGIPQALTETHDMPPGYFTDAEVQIRWGLDYIRDSYGSPCSAWEFKQANNWY